MKYLSLFLSTEGRIPKAQDPPSYCASLAKRVRSRKRKFRHCQPFCLTLEGSFPEVATDAALFDLPSLRNS
jgi:hypothetical protein